MSCSWIFVSHSLLTYTAFICNATPRSQKKKHNLKMELDPNVANPLLNINKIHLKFMQVTLDYNCICLTVKNWRTGEDESKMFQPQLTSVEDVST